MNVKPSMLGAFSHPAYGYCESSLLPSHQCRNSSIGGRGGEGEGRGEGRRGRTLALKLTRAGVGVVGVAGAGIV